MNGIERGQGLAYYSATGETVGNALPSKEALSLVVPA